MQQKKLQIATRESPLAIWQATYVREQLLSYWPALEVELIPMSTTGDQFLKDRVYKIGGKGVFVKELEEALLDKRADLAVHSMKDVPSSLPEGLCLATICRRHNPFDALLSDHYQTLKSLPTGATVGTSSLRRQAQLLALRPDLQIHPLRGNIHTRIDKLKQGQYDAIILAAAGLERMQMSSLIREIFDDQVLLPACGQGALGIECRDDNQAIKQLLAPLHDPLSALCVQTERHVNALLGGNCHTPVAIYCNKNTETTLKLQTKISSIDGKIQLAHCEIDTYHNAQLMAERSVNRLLTQGAQKLLQESLE